MAIFVPVCTVDPGAGTSCPVESLGWVDSQVFSVFPDLSPGDVAELGGGQYWRSWCWRFVCGFCFDSSRCDRVEFFRMNNNNKRYIGLGILALLTLVVGPAQAVISTVDALASVGEAETAITAVGGALIGLAAVVMALKWVKAMFF